MNQNHKIVACAVAVGVGALVYAEPALARDLGAAATTAVTTVKTVARALSVLGVVAGGAAMQIPGASEFGKRTLVAGLIGCLCAFGGPAFVSAIESIFGAG